MTLIIGIDPGGSGGFAWRNTERPSHFADATKLPATESDTAALLRQLRDDNETVMAYLERVGSTPQMGVTSAFTFGKSYGFLRGTLIGLCIPFEEVSPVKWQGMFGLRQVGKKLGKDDVTKHNTIKGKAQQLFPHLRITHATAAALLIAEYGRRSIEPLSAATPQASAS